MWQRGERCLLRLAPKSFAARSAASSQHDVDNLIAGPGVHICDECVRLRNEILAVDGPRRFIDDVSECPVSRILLRRTLPRSTHLRSGCAGRDDPANRNDSQGGIRTSTAPLNAATRSPPTVDDHVQAPGARYPPIRGGHWTKGECPVSLRSGSHAGDRWRLDGLRASSPARCPSERLRCNSFIVAVGASAHVAHVGVDASSPTSGMAWRGSTSPELLIHSDADRILPYASRRHVGPT
jgi:ClpX C4-type zinc finger